MGVTYNNRLCAEPWHQDRIDMGWGGRRGSKLRTYLSEYYNEQKM